MALDKCILFQVFPWHLSAGSSIILHVMYEDRNKMKWNSHNHCKGRFTGYQHSLSGGGNPPELGHACKNIFTVNEGFFHTSVVQVNPTRVEGEQDFPFTSQTGQLTSTFVKNLKDR